MLLTSFILVLLVEISSLQAIDPLLQYGVCRNVTYDTTHYVTFNEGPWFPQYRTETKASQDYSCHTANDAVHYHEDEPTQLAEEVYFTELGKAVKEPFVSYYDVPSRGVYETAEFDPGIGAVQIFMKILYIDNDIRVRYICTTYVGVDPKEPDQLIIDTRLSEPTWSLLDKAFHVISKAGFRVKMMKINQKGCTRPLTVKGYESIIQ